MPIVPRPQMTVSKMLVGGLDIVALPLLQGFTPDEIQDAALSYGFSDFGSAEARFFEYSGALHRDLPSREDRVVVWTPRRDACRVELHHHAWETRVIPRSADAWRRMIARSPDPAWTLELAPTLIKGMRGSTVATVRRG
jgi:hypothetical protein